MAGISAIFLRFMRPSRRFQTARLPCAAYRLRPSRPNIARVPPTAFVRPDDFQFAAAFGFGMHHACFIFSFCAAPSGRTAAVYSKIDFAQKFAVDQCAGYRACCGRRKTVAQGIQAGFLPGNTSRAIARVSVTVQPSSSTVGNPIRRNSILRKPTSNLALWIISSAPRRKSAICLPTSANGGAFFLPKTCIVKPWTRAASSAYRARVDIEVQVFVGHLAVDHFKPVETRPAVAAVGIQTIFCIEDDLACRHRCLSSIFVNCLFFKQCIFLFSFQCTNPLIHSVFTTLGRRIVYFGDNFFRRHSVFS